MSILRTWTALCLLSLMAVLAVQPATAFSGAYSLPGKCGGTSPVAVACTSQHIDVPSGTTSITGYLAVRHYCLTTPCEVGTIRVDMQITGFSPTSYDPAFSRTNSCWFSDAGSWCGDAVQVGSFAAGYDVVISGQISREICQVFCAGPPPTADWCVAVRFNGSGTCPLENPILGDIGTVGAVGTDQPRTIELQLVL